MTCSNNGRQQDTRRGSEEEKNGKALAKNYRSESKKERGKIEIVRNGKGDS